MYLLRFDIYDFSLVVNRDPYHNTNVKQTCKDIIIWQKQNKRKSLVQEMTQANLDFSYVNQGILTPPLSGR